MPPRRSEKNHKQDIQITEIQTNLKWVMGEVRDIKENHLNSIYNRLGELGDSFSKFKEDVARRPTWLITTAITGLVSILVGVTVYLLTH